MKKNKMMQGPSIWYHTFVAEEIIMPKLLGKEKEKKGEEKEEQNEGEKNKRQHKIENINLSLS